MQAFVLDKHKNPLMPCHPARARELLKRGQAVVHKIAPFTIRLKGRVGGEVQPVRIKLDPGSKTTGIALVRAEETVSPETGKMEKVAHVLFLAELTHRGGKIRDRLTARRAFRRRRRGNLRYRKPRFDNRTRPEGWLAPSLQHRVDTTMAWVNRFRKLSPVSDISQELVRFDLQQIETPEISGVEYQQGTLAGYEVREYLLEKWTRTCAYCGKKDVPLEIDHVHPRSKGGTDRVSNLTLACHVCNQKKGSRDLSSFLAKKPETLKRVLSQAKKPLRDASAVNATRWALFQVLKQTGLPVETGSGGRTKWNRIRFGLSKTHALDAACVGNVDRVEDFKPPYPVHQDHRAGKLSENTTGCFWIPPRVFDQEESPLRVCNRRHGEGGRHHRQEDRILPWQGRRPVLRELQYPENRNGGSGNFTQRLSLSATGRRIRVCGRNH
ncbi:MAG: RNA-guided endonuclease IscB [Leptospirales bacterium]